MRNKFLALSMSTLLALSLISCSSGIKATTSPENYSDLDKEYGQFNTKALTVSYLKKKLDKWKKDNNGKKMLRELEYAKFKHINVLEQVINSQPDSYAYYEGLKNFIEVTSKEGNDAAFRSFLVSLSPDPSSVTTLDASNITSTSFTANWSAVTTANGYMLIIDDGTPIDVGNVTSKNITGLTSGSSHSYVVKSVNEGGISEASSPINVTLIPSTPVASDVTNLAQTSFTANWGSVNGATSYKLFVDEISVYTGSSTSCNVTSLTVGSSHSYYVQAINAGGTSTNSNTINLTLNPATPEVPSANVATDITTTSFTANWTSVIGATSYKLKIDNGSFTDVGNITSKNITGLTAGSTHTYTVQAINIGGTSADSNTVSVSTITLAPVASVATDITNTSFTASWATVTGATSYKLFIDDVEAYSGTNLSFSKTGLTANSSHSYYIQAINAGGTSANSNTVNLSLNPNAPTAPVANIATDITTTSFTANWASVTNASSYTLYVNGTSVYTGTNTSFSKTGLTAGSDYTYYVTATNVTGTSSNSNTINVSTVPLAPVATSASDITNTSFTANWGSVTGATSYKLFVDSINVYTGTSTAINITGLTTSSSHSYYVQAINSGGTSGNSNNISLNLKTDTPVATSATNVGTTSFTANWGSVTGATSYKLKIDTGSFTDIGNVTHYDFTSLTDGSTHTYTVQAVNVGGTSNNSNDITVVLKPVAPVANSATSITDTSFTANWASVNNATSYNLFVDGTSVYMGSATNCNVTGLTAGSSHSYYVQAINAGGNSVSSNSISVSTISAVPVATSATNVGTTSFTANWGSVTGATSYKLKIDTGSFTDIGNVTHYDISALIDGSTHTYTVQAVNAGGTSGNSNTISVVLKPVAPVASSATSVTDTSFTANWASVNNATSYNLFVDGTSVYTGTSTNCNITGLTAGSSHSYYVQAVNAGGNSVSSNSIGVSTISAVPVATAATIITDTSFTANWGAVTGATSYKLKIDTGSFTDIGNVTSKSITGLTAGSTHTYTVQAVNAGGTSGNSNTISVVTIPATPTITTTSVTDTSLTGNWGAVTGASSYKFKVDTGSFTDIGNVTSYTATGLASGISHTYYVQAVSSGGTSASSSGTTVTLKPAAPVATAATDITTSSYTAHWNSVTGATSYNLNGSSIGNTTSYPISGLIAGGTYTYTIQAVNASGNSSNSNTVSITTIPSAPVATATTNVASDRFTANWGSVSGATSYNLVVDGTSVNVGNVTTYTKTGLAAGSHTYTVQAVSSGGASTNSNSISTTLISGLVLYYPFNGNTNDVSGNGYNGSVTGSNLLVSDRNSNTNSAFNFNGTTSITSSIPTINYLFTVSMWIKPGVTHEIDAEEYLGATGVSGEKYLIFPAYGGDTSGGFGISAGTNGISIYEHAGAYMPPLLVYQTSVTDWTHIAVVIKNQQSHLYVNGTLVRDGLVSTRTTFLNFNLSSSWYGNYTGLVDEVRVYNRDLTSTEINTIKNQ